MEELTGNIPAWGMFSLAAIYVVVKLSYEFVDRLHKRTLEAEKKKTLTGGDKPPSKGTSYASLKALADATGKHSITEALDQREEKARSQEMHALLKKQDELIAQLAASDESQTHLLEQLAKGQHQNGQILATVVRVLEHQNTTHDMHTEALKQIAARELDASRSWDTLRMSIDNFAKIVEHDSDRPPAAVSPIRQQKG